MIPRVYEGNTLEFQLLKCICRLILVSLLKDCFEFRQALKWAINA